MLQYFKFVHGKYQSSTIAIRHHVASTFLSLSPLRTQSNGRCVNYEPTWNWSRNEASNRINCSKSRYDTIIRG